jgi:cytochrome P450
MRPSHPPSLISEPLPGPSLFKSILGHITISARWMVPGMRSLEGQYGPFFRLRHGIRDIVCVSDPEVAEEFLVRSGDMPKGPSKCPAKLFLGRGLLLSDGAHWRRQRRVMAPYLTPRSVERYSDDIGAVVRDRVADWEDGQHIDVTTEMTEITLRVLSRCLFGDSLPEDGARTVQAILTRALNDVNILLYTWRVWVPQWWPLRARRRLRSLRSEIEELVDLMIAKKLEAGGDEDDLFAEILNLKDERGEPSEKSSVIDEVTTILFAGHETTTTTLTMIWVLLSQHPEIQSRVISEIDQICGDRQIASEDVDKLSLTSAVIKESLRLYPPAWATDRLVSEDRVVRGKTIRAGSAIFLLPILMHSNADFFSRPEDFFPDRWLRDPDTDLPPCAFIPFGRGPRACIGQHFAQRELLITVVTVLQQWTIACSRADDITMGAGYVLRPTSNVTGVVFARRR